MFKSPSASTMTNFQRNPLKLYIQDIFRANRTEANKYIYEIFGMTFKNIMIHGVVTAVHVAKSGTNFELSDLTGSVYVYYDSTKNNLYVPDGTMKDLFRDFAVASRFGDSNIDIMNTMMDRIVCKKKREINEGTYVSVVGDIFVEDLKNVRMVSAYECCDTSVERDIVWMEELRYLYEKFYLSDNK